VCQPRKEHSVERAQTNTKGAEVEDEKRAVAMAVAVTESDRTNSTITS